MKDENYEGPEDVYLRLHSGGVLRQSANGHLNFTGGNDYPLISEEDLLSNIDRLSRLIP